MEFVLLLFTTARFWILLLGLVLSACQTIEDSSVINTWHSVPLPQFEAKQSPARGAASTPPLREQPAGEPTLIEGSGRFVGNPQAASQLSTAEPGTDGVTLNLVNVPVAFKSRDGPRFFDRGSACNRRI